MSFFLALKVSAKRKKKSFGSIFVAIFQTIKVGTSPAFEPGCPTGVHGLETTVCLDALGVKTHSHKTLLEKKSGAEGTAEQGTVLRLLTYATKRVWNPSVDPSVSPLMLSAIGALLL